MQKTARYLGLFQSVNWRKKRKRKKKININNQVLLI